MAPSTAPLHLETPAHERLIVALDVDDAGTARTIVSELKGSVGAFKIGLQLFTSAGPSLVKDICEAGVRIFLDLKFHDIPNTVTKASLEASKLGVWMFNMHASGGAAMMRQATQEVEEFCDRASLTKPLIIGVTVLTSASDQELREIGIDKSAIDQVLALSMLANSCGLDGVVASPLEAKRIREQARTEFVIVTPGIRPKTATHDDQKRVMSPGEALSAGSDYLVVGRPVIGAADRIAAVDAIISEIAQFS